MGSGSCPATTEPPAGLPSLFSPYPAHPGFTALGSLWKPHPGSACPTHREPSGTRAPGGWDWEEGRVVRGTDGGPGAEGGVPGCAWGGQGRVLELGLRGGSGFTRPSWPKGTPHRGNRGSRGRPTRKAQGAHRLRVGEWPEAVIVLLPGSVPQPQVHRLAVHHHVS